MKHQTSIASMDSLHVSLFAPIDRETPIVEILYNGKVMLDLSYEDDCAGNNVNVLFHNDITEMVIDSDILTKVIAKARARLLAGE